MELGWVAVLQAGLIAISTWYVRRGSHQDAERVKISTASQSTSNEILRRVEVLEMQMMKVLLNVSEDGPDHRGPKKS